jgi:hypothetical protein
VSVEETFAKVVGRHASDEERRRLYRLRDALGLRDNDAFWSIVMALEYYDSFFRRYPAELAELHRTLHRGRTRGLRGSGGAGGRAGAADALGNGRGDERRDRAAARRATSRP